MTDQSRRAFLRIAGGAGATALVAWGTGSFDAAQALATRPSASARLAADTSTGCATLTPDLTEGPFWIDEKLERSDIRADHDTGAVQAGVPLALTITLLDAGAGCTPQAGMYLDVWHANAAGAYSDVSGSGNPDNRGVDWLRGYQVSDADGQVRFTTIFPGWYSGRTMHVHFRIRSSLDSSASTNFTSQLFFTEAVDAAVAASSGYTKSGTRTTNSTDNIYDAATVVPVSGSTSAGYTGAFTVNLDYGDGAGSGDTTVAASLVAATVERRSGGRRHLVVTTSNDEVVTQVVRLERDDDLLARRVIGWKSAGTRSPHVVVPSTVVAGAATATVKFVDEAGNTKIASLPVTVPHKRG